TISTVVNPTAPDDLAALGATDTGSGSATVTFTAANDPNHFGTQFWRGTTTTFEAATPLDPVYSAPGAQGGFTDPTGFGTFYYWAAPINSSDVQGIVSGPVSVVVSDPGP
ncbi:MAG: hypothetical protein KDK24_21765, partial [Pseudooceanicola sp.]|nr:hypothetical protein [Pseudooceanicola sp.]